MKDKENIKILSEEIIELENELKNKNNIKSNQQKIKEIINSLSIQDIFQLDEYIMEYYKNKR